MPLAFHSNPSEKYRQQYVTAREHIVPFVDEVVPVRGARVLEIGCGEGGVLGAFLDGGAAVVGVDLSAAKVAFAQESLGDAVADGRAEFVAADIYEDAFSDRFAGAFDVVVMKDTIEHVFGHERILRRIRRFLNDRGVLFVAFPPWYMPYGGHQQMADSRAGKLPFYHLLPRGLYRRVLRALGESEPRVQDLLDIYDTRLTIGQFERHLRTTAYRTLRRRFFLVNPIYSAKFGLQPRLQLPVLRSLPFVRDFVTTTCYYVVQPVPVDETGPAGPALVASGRQ